MGYIFDVRALGFDVDKKYKTPTQLGTYFVSGLPIVGVLGFRE